jgi:hypothetical protein
MKTKTRMWMRLESWYPSIPHLPLTFTNAKNANTAANGSPWLIFLIRGSGTGTPSTRFVWIAMKEMTLFWESGADLD